MEIHVDPHPLLAPAGFTSRFASPLGELPSPDWLLEMLSIDAEAPVARTEETRQQVRDLLRHGGYKPTGRGKPASEYLVRAAGDGSLGSINAAVDACNVVSLHSALPISLVDLGRARPPFGIAIAPAGASYLFNASGQEIDLGGLLCLFDTEGPCANAVKDSQRTKTAPDTRETLSIIWGLQSDRPTLERAVDWYREIVAKLGGTTEDLIFEQAAQLES
jgi:DNA/RNA-binding domain of Phe-tRNA-synthetase-like protein